MVKESVPVIYHYCDFCKSKNRAYGKCFLCGSDVCMHHMVVLFPPGIAGNLPPGWQVALQASFQLLICPECQKQTLVEITRKIVSKIKSMATLPGHT